MLRPELRFDHSWDAGGYDNGKGAESVLLRNGLDLQVLTQFIGAVLFGPPFTEGGPN